MRYARAKSKDWVEFKPGADGLSIDELAALWALDAPTRNGLLLAWVDSYAFFNRHGESIVLETSADIGRLTPKQLDWLRQSLVDWTRDEDTSPEA